MTLTQRCIVPHHWQPQQNVESPDKPPVRYPQNRSSAGSGLRSSDYSSDSQSQEARSTEFSISKGKKMCERHSGDENTGVLSAHLSG